MDKARLRSFGLLCLALVSGACSRCDECSDEFSLRIQFSDSDNNPIFTDINELLVTDFTGTSFDTNRTIDREDTIFQISLVYEDPLLDPPDSIIVFYNDALIDSAAIALGFTNDDECCDNVFTIDNARFLNRPVSRLIRSEGVLYRIIIE